MSEGTSGNVEQEGVAGVGMFLAAFVDERAAEGALERIMAISRRCASLPTLDKRPEEEILGYGENSAPV